MCRYSGNNGEHGVSKMTGEILRMVTMLPGTVKQMTGVNMSHVRDKDDSGDQGEHSNYELVPV